MIEHTGAAVPAHVLAAFGVGGPVPLSGGQGTSMRADGLVLKPEADPEEARWLAGLGQRLAPDGFRFPAPVRSGNGDVVVDGWTATPFVEGEPVVGDDASVATWLQVLAAGRALHRAAASEPRPAFLDGRSHRWAAADRAAWGEHRVVPGWRTAAILDHLDALVVDEGLASQLVHGDLSGNVLLAPGLEPAVIDLAPYWRPAAYADAVVVVDALLWWRAAPQLVHAGRPSGLDHRRWLSLLSRAAVFRLLAFAEESRTPGEVERELAAYERVVGLLTRTARSEESKTQ